MRDLSASDAGRPIRSLVGDRRRRPRQVLRAAALVAAWYGLRAGARGARGRVSRRHAGTGSTTGRRSSWERQLRIPQEEPLSGPPSPSPLVSRNASRRRGPMNRLGTGGPADGTADTFQACPPSSSKYVPLPIGRATRHPSRMDGVRSYRSGRWTCRTPLTHGRSGSISWGFMGRRRSPAEPIPKSLLRYTLGLSIAMVVGGLALLWIGIALERALGQRLLAGSAGALLLVCGIGIFVGWCLSRRYVEEPA